MEKLQYVVFTCLLTVAFSLSNQLLVSPSTFGRRLGRELHISAHKPVVKQNTEIVRGIKKPETMNGSKGLVQNEDGEELIFIADYPGVSTHHSPHPKHPKPLTISALLAQSDFLQLMYCASCLNNFSTAVNTILNCNLSSLSRLCV